MNYASASANCDKWGNISRDVVHWDLRCEFTGFTASGSVMPYLNREFTWQCLAVFCSLKMYAVPVAN